MCRDLGAGVSAALLALQYRHVTFCMILVGVSGGANLTAGILLTDYSTAVHMVWETSRSEKQKCCSLVGTGEVVKGQRFWVQCLEMDGILFENLFLNQSHSLFRNISFIRYEMKGSVEG